MYKAGAGSWAKRTEEVKVDKEKVIPSRHKLRRSHVSRWQQTTPFLVRVFTKAGGHHQYVLCADARHLILTLGFDREDDFKDKLPTDDELQIYTWYAAAALADVAGAHFPCSRSGNLRP